MIKRYYDIFQELSKLHIVPYHKWDNITKNILTSLLKNIPFFITKNGNVFLGEDSLVKIKNNKICFQAHLDHPGGKLYFNQDKSYMYSKFYGQISSQYLINRKFGVFLPGMYENVDKIMVEHCYNDRKEGVTLFFKSNNELIEKYNSGQLVVHYDEFPKLENNVLINWNLDNILNVALIIYLLKYENYIDKYYGLLTINEEVGHLGLYEFLNAVFDKDLYFISMDVIHSDIDTCNSFGIRTKQDGIKLDKFIPKKIICDINEKYKAEIPFGVCEGVTLTREGRPNMSLFVKINNFHNGLPFKKFASEDINITILKDYANFVKDIATKVKTILNNNIVHLNSRVPYKKLDINIINYDEYIRNIILGCNNYTDYLNRGLLEIRKVFSKYNLNIPNISGTSYYKYREFLLNKEIITIDKDNLYKIARYLINEIEGIFKTNKEVLLKDIDNIEIIRILLGNFNACNYFIPKQIIMLSIDNISNSEILLRLIVHELTHFLTSNIWRSINIPYELRKYYDEGLAVYLSAKKFNIEIYESLGMTKETYDKYLNQKYKLKELFSDFSKGNFYKLYKGKFHEYFIKNNIPHPFYVTQNDISRYGYFLSAIETKKMIEEGNYYEKILY